MFNKLKELYISGKLNEKHLQTAVKMNWLTEEELNKIIKSK